MQRFGCSFLILPILHQLLATRTDKRRKKNVRENEAKTGNLKRKLELVDGIRRASDASAFRAISPATRSSSANY
jgi:hypothetical protein